MTSGRSGHVFKNWGLTQCCQPDLYFEPSSEDDLRQVGQVRHKQEARLSLSHRASRRQRHIDAHG